MGGNGRIQGFFLLTTARKRCVCRGGKILLINKLQVHLCNRIDFFNKAANVHKKIESSKGKL